MRGVSMIILAAGSGTRLRPHTENRPKCLVGLHGRPLIEWHLAAARAAGLSDITLVGGYRAEMLPTASARLVRNESFETTNMVASLLCARQNFAERVVVAYGDILYNTDVLKRLLDAPAEISVVIDRAWYEYWRRRGDDPLDDAESLRLDARGAITDIGQRAASIDEIEGQYIGLLSFSGAGLGAMLELCQSAAAANGSGETFTSCPRPFANWYMTDLLQALIARGETVQAVLVDGGWLEIDNVRDLNLAEQITVRRNGLLDVAR